MNKKYWQSFGERTSSENFEASAQKEFKEELLPIEDLDGKGLLDAKTPRRDFLKYLGFSTAAAAIAAGCETPVRKAVPFLQRPDDVIPGIANYYASTYVNGGDAIPVVVKQRDGRPIKIEGNELSPLFMGGTNAQCQASVLDLYDPTRLRHPLQKSGNEFKEIPSFDAVDRMIAQGMTAAAGKAMVLLTSTIHSPTTLQVISNFLAKYPGSRHVQYDAVSHSGMLMANGGRLPVYDFTNAKVIVSLGADFLGTWLNSTVYSKQYAENKKVKGNNPTLSRHIQFESMMSMTGSNADDRYTHKPSQTGAIALALLAAVGGGGSASGLDAKLADAVRKAGAELKAAGGNAIVVCGSNDANIQTVVTAINDAIGANGVTIDKSKTLNIRKGIDADMVRLANDMASGAVGGLLVYDCNPVYTYFEGKKFGESLARLPFSVSFNSTLCETSELCKYVIPSHHWLESWGDAEVQTGSVSFIQPVINPLFKTRPFQTSLINWSGGHTATAANAGAAGGNTNVTDTTARMMSVPSPAADAYEAMFRNYWGSKLGGEAGWNKALQDGIVAESAGATTLGTVATLVQMPAMPMNVAGAASKISAEKAGNYEVVLYQKISVGTGAQANNPWLQELPDPISKVTWDNYAMVSPALAKEIFGLDVHNMKEADKYEVTPEKPVLKITVGNRSISLPTLIIPGLDPKTVAVAVGYGRRSASDDKDINLDRIGRAAYGAGQNAYPMAMFDGTGFRYNSSATLEKTGDVYPLAQTQVHGFTESRPVIYETNLASYKKDPTALLEETRKEIETIMPHGKEDYVRDATIYPDYAKPGVKWGMAIDLNTCTGCSACVVACTAENNVSVVGKIQVQRYHEMHWLRIDRYFTGSPENPDVVYQPMLCQHCDNAPCENVCPVAATNHSTEGLNQMTYNRCIGTRYCANNCPYKVRRFNWLDYNGSDSFPDNQKALIGHDTNEVIMQMNDELTRMVLNPDVTVRSRGVIEKCSFCVQRLQDAKLEAKKNQDPSQVRNVKVACAQACPSDCITFGNVNDPQSEVSKIRNRDQKNRNFYVLEQLHVLPNVSYLAKVKNTLRDVNNGSLHGEHEAAGPVAETEHA